MLTGSELSMAITAVLIAAVCAAGFLFAAVLAYPQGLGMGDVKLALLLGAVLGASVGVALMIGMFAVWFSESRKKATARILPMFWSRRSIMAAYTAILRS